MLPAANPADAVAGALAEHLSGSMELRAYEMLREDFADALLIPTRRSSSPRSRTARRARRSLSALLSDEVLPELERGTAGTGLGLNVHWTLGVAERPVDESAARPIPW